MMGDLVQTVESLEVGGTAHEVLGKMNNAVGGSTGSSQEYGEAKAEFEPAMAKAMLRPARRSGRSAAVDVRADREAWALTRCGRREAGVRDAHRPATTPSGDR